VHSYNGIYNVFVVIKTIETHFRFQGTFFLSVLNFRVSVPRAPLPSQTTTVTVTYEPQILTFIGRCMVEIMFVSGAVRLKVAIFCGLTPCSFVTCAPTTRQQFVTETSVPIYQITMSSFK
jgi:hypothetical protein